MVFQWHWGGGGDGDVLGALSGAVEVIWCSRVELITGVVSIKHPLSPKLSCGPSGWESSAHERPETHMCRKLGRGKPNLAGVETTVTTVVVRHPPKIKRSERKVKQKKIK